MLSPAGDASHLPRYRFPAGFVLRWLASAALRRRRVLTADAQALIKRHPAPCVLDAIRLPEAGSFVLVLNHYERPGMPVWWSALYVEAVLTAERPGLEVRWMVANRLAAVRIRRVPVVPESAMRWFVSRVASTYGALLVDPRDPRRRARVLREARRVLTRGEVVAITPEAGNPPGRHGQLRTAVSASGSAIGWLSGGRVPVVPVGLWEDRDGRVFIRVGESRTLQPKSHATAEEMTTEVMMRIARLLPPELRGPYGIIEEGGP